MVHRKKHCLSFQTSIVPVIKENLEKIIDYTMSAYNNYVIVVHLTQIRTHAHTHARAHCYRI